MGRAILTRPGACLLHKCILIVIMRRGGVNQRGYLPLM